MVELSKSPVADRAEHNAFFPSEYSLSQYVAKKTDFAGTPVGKIAGAQGKKILVVATDERYLLTQSGSFFSTGNHPVETLLPMLHLHEAGFELEIATLSGNPAKFEIWAMPSEDEAVCQIYETYLPQIKQPKKLADLLPAITAADSAYAGVFIPGGHAAMIGIPFSQDVKTVLKWAMANDKAVISLCHGPAGLLAAAIDEAPENFVFNGYKMCVFPDALDEGANIAIGYIPGRLPWLVAERLEALGVKVLNEGITGQVHRDRNVLTGDSPLAANALGILAAEYFAETLS